MGYGVKTDYTTGRELDLDKTYKNIIKPVVEECGLKCIRGDEIIHSGIIDNPMYKYLYHADIVIADLSTYNPNAFYELGVRHGIKPFTTIAIAEKELKYPFDLNHVVIRTYEHLGKDIGFDEAMRFRKELKDAIDAILKKQDIDSPVYTYLKGLKPPFLEIPEDLPEISGKETLSDIVANAISLMDTQKDFLQAKSLFEKALLLDPENDYLIKKMTLSTYKSEYPTKEKSLDEAWGVISILRPDVTTDPETLGLSGAIYKRKFDLRKDVSDLTQSIFYYEKGFNLNNDYYNGVNLAFLYDLRSSVVADLDDKKTDAVLAKRIRYKVIDICEAILRAGNDNRNDLYWVNATLEECYFGLRLKEKYNEYKCKAMSFSTSKWQRESTEVQIARLEKMLGSLS